jgi:hypothetical protein
LGGGETEGGECHGEDSEEFGRLHLESFLSIFQLSTSCDVVPRHLRPRSNIEDAEIFRYKLDMLTSKKPSQVMRRVRKYERHPLYIRSVQI